MSRQQLEEQTKRLKQLEALEKLGAQHNVTLHQALAQQTALRPQVTVEELKRIISSPKPEHNEAAKNLLVIWNGLIKDAISRSQKVSPTNQELVQASPKASPPSSEELNTTKSQLEEWGKQTGVTLERVAIALERNVTAENLQAWIDSGGEKERRAAAFALDKWRELVKAKDEEIKKMRGATPKEEVPSKELKVVESSVAEEIGLTKTDQQYILDQHNQWRRNVTEFPQQKGKPPLEYDSALAAHAQGWANHLAQTGLWKHNPNEYVQGFPGTVGENIDKNMWKGGPGRTREQLLERAVDRWVDEYKNYDFTNHKSKGGDVGHFTQVVWRDTKKVGCGLALVERKDGWIWCYVVCCYHPTGNVVDREAENV